MKLSERTLNIIQNFSSINSSIKIKPGKVLSTKTAGTKTIVAFANIDETFTHEINIYDLNKFRKIVSLFNEPEFDIKTIEKDGNEEVTHAIIKDSKLKKSFKFCFSSPELIEEVGQIKTIPEWKITFDVESETIQDLLSTANAANLDSIAIESDGEVIKMTAYNETNNGTGENKYSIDVGVSDGAKYKMVLKKEYLKLLSGKYRIEIAEAVISKFTNLDYDVSYFIVLQKSSIYEGK